MALDTGLEHQLWRFSVFTRCIVRSSFVRGNYCLLSLHLGLNLSATLVRML